MKNRIDTIGSLILFFLGIGAVGGAIRLHIGTPTQPQPGFFPFLAGISLIILSPIIFLKGRYVMEPKKNLFGEVSRPAMLLLVMIGIVVTLSYVGYVIGSFIASVLILRIMRVKSWSVLLLTGLFISSGTYLLFDKLLGVELPVGFLSVLHF